MWSEAELPVILLPATDLDRPVELLQEHYPRQRVRQGHWPEGEVLVGPLQHLRREPERPTEHERYVTASRDAKSRELACEFLRGDLFSTLAVEGHCVGARRYPLEETLPLRREHLFGALSVHVLFRDFDYLDGEVTPEAGQIVIAALGRPSLQPTDGDDGGASD